MICLAVLDRTLVLLPVDVKMGVWLEREQEELPDRQHRKPVYFSTGFLQERKPYGCERDETVEFMLSALVFNSDSARRVSDSRFVWRFIISSLV